jgi:hypothetical protein
VTWRERAKEVICEVIERVGRNDEKALRAALREAYPFGMRKYHPYKVWLDEIKVQLNRKKPPTGRTVPSCAGQAKLF